MPRYFFDTQAGRMFHDTEGSDCADFDAARAQAMASLPEIARWTIPKNGDRQALSISVRDENGAIVYTATLTFAGRAMNQGRPIAMAG